MKNTTLGLESSGRGQGKDKHLPTKKAKSKVQQLTEKYHRVKLTLKTEKFPKKYFTDKTEKGLIECIIADACLRGYHVMRIDNRGYSITKEDGSKVWTPSKYTNGVSDLIATIPYNGVGLFVGIELKVSKSDFQRPEQKDFQKKIERVGGKYVIIRKYAEWCSWYDENIVRQKRFNKYD